ncbi:MAG: hypothetical protein DRQ88_12730 [Epsilonproteobacteria bacterium]|nr:MAG: hypothetical protein DRQ88_12730 [Campylobacterota bacterium]
MRSETKNEKIRRIFNADDFGDSSIERDVMRLRDKNLSESEKLNKIIRVAEERSPRLSLFNEFLSCNVLSQIINTKIFPKYRKPVVSVAVDHVIKEQFEIIQKMWFSYSDTIKPANVEEVQTDIDKSQEVLVLGYYFMKHKETGNNMIFGIDFIEGFNTGYIAMYTNEGDSKIASKVMKDIIFWARNNNFLKNKKIDTNGRFLKLDGTKMEDVILKEEIKNRIKSGTIDMLANVEKYKKNNLPIKRGILMEGEPGTGKTLLAKALAQEIESTFIWVTADDVTYPSDVSYIYDMARELSPTVVLFEDIDYIGKDREGYSGSFDKITGELLNQLDGVQSNEGIITLASSNYPKALDKALRNRPGRFDIRVRFELPDSVLREKMLIKFFGPTDISDLDMPDMVEKSDGYTGAYIKELVVATVMLAVTKESTMEDGTAIVKKEFFEEAFNQLEESRNLDDKE